jgi:type I restriction enzyme S subunit
MTKRWPIAKLRDLTRKIGSGATPRGGDEVYKTSGVPLIRSMNVHFAGFKEEGLVYLDHQEAKKLDHVKVEANDVLLNITGASIGRVTTTPESMAGARVNQHVCIIRPNPELYPRFLAQFLASPDQQRKVMNVQVGVTRQALTKAMVLDWEIPLPPLDEQRQLVAEIEKQFSCLDEAVANLKRVKANLKRYKAAVLKAAVEGKLTEDWRRTHLDVEPASELLKRILAERRTRWNGKGKYKEPSQSSTSDLPPVPQGWVWATVESLSTRVVDGVHKKPDYAPSGVPFVTVRNLTAGPGISFEHLNYITEDDHNQFIKRANPERGDILVSKDGTLGVIRVIDSAEVFSIFVSVALVKPVLKGMNNYFAVALQSPQVQAQMVPKGSGLQHIHLEDLRQDCIPLPSLVEQQRIVEEVERRLSIIEDLETIAAVNFRRSDKLRQSILNKAFTGTLDDAIACPRRRPENAQPPTKNSF